MSRFIQMHLLTSYPPSNLNRDDLGRPKTAMMGGNQRLRISSQSLKRAWRDSDKFKNELDGYLGKRTKRIGLEWVYKDLTGEGIDSENAKVWSLDIQRVFGEPESEDKKKEEEPSKVLLNKQLAHIAPIEEFILRQLIADIGKMNASDSEANANEIVKEIYNLQKERNNKKKAEDKNKITDKIVKTLRQHILKERHSAADIALFGRMLARSPKYNVEAAAQVAHAITVHEVAIEDDFFTAVDDLKARGVGHMGETEFGAGLFYLYACINRELLQDNLNGDHSLANRTLAALTEAATTVSPSGKQNSFGSRAYASYILAEKGDQQPRSLAVAFLKAVADQDMLGTAIKCLENSMGKMDRVYGSCAESRYVVNTETGEGSLKELINFVTE